jgi:cyclase
MSGILLSVFFVSAGFAQQAAPAISVEKIRGNIYQIKGGAGANTGFVIGEKNVVVIDAKMTEEAGRQMVDEIKRLTPLPIKWIIITHSDQDHVNGLVGLPQGVPVIAQENTRVHMDKAFRSSIVILSRQSDASKKGPVRGHYCSLVQTSISA